LYRRIFNLLALCVLVTAAAATWYWSRPREPMTAAVGTADDRPPSYYLKDADVLQTNEEGRLLYRIHAELVEEHPDDEALVLDGVLFEYREAEEIPWHVRAGRAVIRLESQILELEQGVELIREPGQNGKGIVARTEHLVLEPQRHVARADGEVTFTVGASTLSAVGLVALFKEDRLKLESNVRGYLQR
jgi:lipopolysaccharide export system protein LptC